MTLPPGTLLAERYRLGDVLGEGGMGVVYRGTDIEAGGSEWAVKVLNRRMKDTDIQRELQASTRLTHPNIRIVRALETDTKHGVSFLLMELLEGQPLSTFVAEHGALNPLTEFREVMVQIADALAHAHELRIVHRDLKPENVFVCSGPPHLKVKLMDFGIAKMLDDGSQASRVVGTPAFMAPEQLGMGDKKVTPATDVWAFGLVAFFALTRRSYWINANGGDGVDTGPIIAEILSHRTHDAASVRADALGSQVPRWFDAWFGRCLAWDAKQRYETVRQACDAMLGSLRKKVTKTPAPSDVESVIISVASRKARDTAPPDAETQEERRLSGLVASILRERLPEALRTMEAVAKSPPGTLLKGADIADDVVVDDDDPPSVDARAPDVDSPNDAIDVDVSADSRAVITSRPDLHALAARRRRLMFQWFVAAVMIGLAIGCLVLALR